MELNSFCALLVRAVTKIGKLNSRLIAVEQVISVGSQGDPLHIDTDGVLFREEAEVEVKDEEEGRVRKVEEREVTPLLSLEELVEV